MKITKIKIRNLFGVAETELDGRSVEITGDNGAGKTSIIDAIRYALTNASEREYVLRKGEREGEILIETDTGLHLNRKKRDGQTDYKSIKEGGREVSGPEAMLRTLFTPFQLDPVAFINMTKAEQNRAILNLIEFDWNLAWIREQFGELPEGIDYEQNILEVLHDIQSENGPYYGRRQDINREMRNKRAFVEDIANNIPSGYVAEHWERFDLGAAYRELEKVRAENSKIERAKAFRAGYDAKKRGLEAEREIAIAAAEREIETERRQLTATIERLKAELIAAEEKVGTLSEKLAGKTAVIDAQHAEALTKLDADTGIANQYADKEPVDTTEMQEEAETAEAMKAHLNEYRRMMAMLDEVRALKEASDELTSKIELARTLPGEILRTATIPVEGLTVEDGVPLIRGLPISNLSEGEKLSLCVDVALSRPNALQIILIDGAEKLSDQNRNALYERCKAHGLQFIATRTTNEDELEVRYL